MPELSRILIVADLPTDAELNEREVRAVLPNSEFVRVETRDAFLAALASFRPDLILSDYRMPQLDGLSALKLALEHAPETPFIIVTGSTDEDTAVECMKAGAWDYIIKEHTKRLGSAIENALAQRQARRERRRAEDALRESNRSLQFLYDISNGLNSASRVISIEAYVARALREHLGARLVLVSRYNPERRTIETRHVDADSTVLKTLASILKADVLGFKTAVDEAAYRRLESQRVAILPDAHEASFGAVPKAMSSAMTRMLGLGKFVALALVHRDRVWGTVMSVLPAGAPLPDEKTLGTASELIAQAMERRDSEEARRESRAKLDAAMASMTDAVFVSDASGKFIDFNEAFAVFHRFSDKAACARHLSDYPNIIDVFMANGEPAPLDMWAVPRALRGETATNVEYGLRRKDTGERWIGSYSFSPIRDESRAIVGSVVVGRDITELRRLQESLRKSEEQFRVAQELSPDGFSILRPVRNAQGQVVDFTWVFENSAVARLNGTEPRAVVGRRLLEVFPDPRGSQFLSAYQHVAQSGEHRVFEAEYAREGAPEPMFLRVVVVPMGGDIAVLTQDITDRRRAEAERERLVRAIEQAAETIFVADAHGTILYVNPAFEAVSGYARAELLGKNPRLLKSGVHDEAFYRNFWDTISSGKTWHGRFVNRRKDGTLYTEEATVSPVRATTGAITSYVAVARDITRDLSLEAQLLQSQKMEGIGRLAGGVAHDFNNLLSVILNYAQFALNGMPEGDPLRDDLFEVKKAGERAASLTRQLLAFSRKQVLLPESLDLNQVLVNMEKMLRRIIGEDIDLVQVLESNLGRVKADPGQVEQVVMNLVVNARDAMPRGGKLTIETANVDLDAESASQHQGLMPGPHVMVAITDSGIGMDEQTMARIFEPFFTTKGTGQGTGLGLSTVFGIVKQSGGGIFVYSELGRGTTFKVLLPRELSTSTATVTSAPTEVRRVTGTETILLVEDEEAVRKVARRILEAAGYTVLTAANGEDALLTSARHVGDIHLLVTDVVMPQMGGRVLAEELAKTRPALKVLYMSGYTDNALVHHGMLDTGTQLIAKPFTSRSLTQKVQEVLAGGITAGTSHGDVQSIKPDEVTKEEVVDKDPLRGLPRHLLDALREAAICARYDEIVALVNTLRTTRPDVAALVRSKADQFDYEGLLDLLGVGEE